MGLQMVGTGKRPPIYLAPVLSSVSQLSLLLPSWLLEESEFAIPALPARSWGEPPTSHPPRDSDADLHLFFFSWHRWWYGMRTASRAGGTSSRPSAPACWSLASRLCDL